MPQKDIPTGSPIERAMMDDIMVAYRLNGMPLPLEHGFPARRIVPGHYGMKHVPWLTEIKLIPSNYIVYDQRTDWSDEAIVKTKSWILDHGPTTGATLTARKEFIMQGFAFARFRWIRPVDISTDGGESWAAPPPAPSRSSILLGHVPLSKGITTA